MAALAFGVTPGLGGVGAQAQTANAKKVEVAGKKSVKVSTESTDEKPERKAVPFMFGLFNAQKPAPAQLSDEQLKIEEKYEKLAKRRPAKVADRFQAQSVPFHGYVPGTIVIDTKQKYLYFVESPVSAMRYGVAVGKEGLLFTGKAKVGAKQVWPRWMPTKEMVERDPRHYKRYEGGMDGGPNNPLGARAIYLYQGKQDTYLRIHGTNRPNSIGSAASNGCFRMLNKHVIDLYDRVKMGAPVVVL
jgi:lipoprotein-anchoring transpeptidase ErfK/SrfK